MLRARSFLIVIIGFVLLALVGASVPFLLSALRDDQRWVQHTLEVKTQIGKVTVSLQDMVIGQGRHLISRDDGYIAYFNDASQRSSVDIAELAAIVSDNAEQRQRAARLSETEGQLRTMLAHYVDMQKRGQQAEVFSALQTGSVRPLIERSRAILAEMDGLEDKLLVERQTETQHSLTVTQFFIYGLLAFIALLTVAVVRDTRERFLALQKTTRELEASIEQERALQNQLQQSQKMEAIGQLAGGIAHDFNNMLAVVLSSLSLFKRRSAKGDTDTLHFIDSAMEGASRAAKLTHRLLAYSRQQPLSPQPIDANRFISDMSELLGRALGEQIRLETVLAGGLWKTFADSSQLENSILNLSINARDAMPDGGKLTIETANAHLDDGYASQNVGAPPGQYVLIAVTDEGSGMSEEVVRKAFDPFFTTKGVSQGTGLGLSQVHGFVRQSGGHIKIYSEVGHGTTVKIYLPRHVGADLPERPKTGEMAVTPRGRLEEVILVLEDDIRVRSVVVESLRELGYTTLHADNGERALAMLAEHQGNISLLFTDVIMPGMNGRQVVERARQIYPGLKVIYTTGFSRNAIIHNGTLEAGVNFIAKPFTFDALATKVRSVLDEPS